MIEKMKWRRNQQQQQEQEERRKQEGKENEKKSKKRTSSFSFSSWLAKLKPKRSIATVAAARDAVFAPPPSPRPPDPSPRSASAHLCFSPAARFPPPVPRRLSVWDDAGDLRPRIAPVRARRRSARHHSVGDLELTLLGHISPFSRRWAASDSGTDASGRDLGHGRRPPRPRRRRSARTTGVYASDQRADPDAKDGLPRRSFTGKIRHRAKVRVRSPRTAAVRAEEVERMRAASRSRGLERFAVVKCSCDPQRDFRESMVEMIWEKGLGRPEEMESLLACYLALNSDEHHDVIVKVFRQLWFELNLERLAHESNRRR